MLITLIVVLLIFGIIWYLVNYLLPVDPRFIQIIDIVLVVLLIIYLLSFLPLTHRLIP